jgi:hypothetical protein
LLAGLRPLLVPSRLDDIEQKVFFMGGKYLKVPGGLAIAQDQDGDLLMVASLRNAGAGLAVLHGWRFYPRDMRGDDRPGPEDFTNQTRDLYVPPGDVGFWQGAFRDAGSPDYQVAHQAIKNADAVTVDLLYGDHEGGQRVITRFVLRTGRSEGVFVSSATHHWNVDRPDPR